MSVVETSTYCSTCQRHTLHHKQRVNHVLHLILSVLTAGLWAVFVWLPLGAKNSATRMRCTVCGNKPGLATARHEIADAFEVPRRFVDGRSGGIGKGTAPVADDEIPPSTWLPPGAREPRS